MKQGNKVYYAAREAQRKRNSEKFMKEYFAVKRKIESEHQKLINQKK